MKMKTPTHTETAATAATTVKPGTNYTYSGVTLAPEQLELALQTLEQLQDILPPMPDLTPRERQRISRVGLRTRGFVDAALDAAKSDPDLLPRNIALSDFVAQDNFLRGLGLLQAQVADLKSRLDAAALLVGNHVYSVSRTVYALMKTDAAKSKMQSQQALMKQRFVAKKNSQPATGASIEQ
jgi:hypothetical protein